MGRVVAEVEFQVARLTKLASGNGAQGGTGREELDVGEAKRLVAVLSFMKRVLSRILRPPTLLQVRISEDVVTPLKFVIH